MPPVAGNKIPTRRQSQCLSESFRQVLSGVSDSSLWEDTSCHIQLRTEHVLEIWAMFVCTSGSSTFELRHQVFAKSVEAKTSV
jgi:hypothetical protein